MLTMIGLLRRRAGLSPEDFQAYWREKHSTLGRQLPGLRRYVQNHTLLSGYREHAPLYDGVAELRFDDPAAFRAAMRSDEMAAARADEPNFLDTEQLGMILAHEHVVLDGPAPRAGVKLISFLTRRADLDPGDFHKHWRERHGPIAARIPNASASFMKSELSKSSSVCRPNWLSCFHLIRP